MSQINIVSQLPLVMPEIWHRSNAYMKNIAGKKGEFHKFAVPNANDEENEAHNIHVFLLNLTTYIVNRVSKQVACSPSILLGVRLILTI